MAKRKTGKKVPQSYGASSDGLETKKEVGSLKIKVIQVQTENSPAKRELSVLLEDQINSFLATEKDIDIRDLKVTAELQTGLGRALAVILYEVKEKKEEKEVKKDENITLRSKKAL